MTPPTTSAPDVGAPAGFLPRGRGVVWFGASGFVNALGTGFFYPFSLLFFTSLSGLSLRAVGVALTITTLLALPGLFVVGRLADRCGPRTVLVAASAVRALALVAFVSVPGVWPLVLGGTALALGNRAEQVATPLLAARLAHEEQRSRWLALSRVTFNGGMGAGALLAAVFVVDTASGFVVLGLVNAASFVMTAVLCLGLPTTPPGAPAEGARPAHARIRPWKHRAFVRVASANALLWAAALAMESALPVFVLRELALPSWTVGVLFAVNTALLTALPLPLSRLLDRLRPGHVLAVGGLCYVVLFAAAALARTVSPTVALVVLTAGMTVYTIGELAVSQASLVLLTGLPPDEERGTYLASNQVLVGIATALAPLLATSLPGVRSAALWWALAGWSLAAGLLARGIDLPRPGPTPEAKGRVS
ncbi:MFS transporter [Streptomyces dysideae]|uniref:MFS transporter n=1 Tax=Streptomyces dysideae TaxID=909626 RepID=A0A101UTV4_9ACTN|nr:MFS transporter [Streptomyces dysideae]KUO16768.1 MFS transporter [Streptomyces dysideae]